MLGKLANHMQKSELNSYFILFKRLTHNVLKT